jgi:undecaprenyl diphosphate synthase
MISSTKSTKSTKKKKKRSLNSKPIELETLNPVKLPRHVAIIPDGNGRWAKRHFMSRSRGHEKGSETVRDIVRVCRELNIEVLTFFAFSTENWQRPEKEVKALMQLMKRFLESEEPEMVANDIRFGVIGQMHRFPVDLQSIVERVRSSTVHNKSMLLNLALSYGSRAEIVEMARAIALKAVSGSLKPDDITESVVADHLYTRGLPDPDLLIRTSGEFRISNFLLWQIAYAEVAISPTLWPDFSRDEFLSILLQYEQRDRRYGKVKPDR